MGSPFPLPLVLPVAVWGALALSLTIALYRAGSPLLLRLAAVFLALWALLATTALVWVVLRGGLGAIPALATHPSSLFEASAWDAWRDGALGAFAVLAVVFTLNQLVGRGVLTVLRPVELAWPASLPRPRGGGTLMTFDSPRREAFSFALVALSPRGRPRRREYILLSRRLLADLSPEEREAVVAHELGHLLDLDARYLTFVRTFARLMRWDPVVGWVAAALTRHEEIRADVEAVRRTRRPLALARALYKSAGGTDPRLLVAGVAFVGGIGRRGRAQLVDRIRRLVVMHESGDFAEERGAP